MLSDEAEGKNVAVTLRDDTNSPASKLIYVLLGLLVIYVIVRGVVGAKGRPFWYDEILTVTIASQPSLQALWHAVGRGFDGMPPGFYLVERAALAFISNKQIALRLPSILAFPCTLICVFVYVKKRSGEAIAFLCALLLLSTSLFHTYLFEARPYSMVLACIAFALVCYQRLPSVLWAALLGISFLVAESLHYYAIFAMVPFGCAEAVFLLRARQFRWPVWIALACGSLPLIVFWRLISALKTVYGLHTFARPVFSALPGYYGSFFLLPETAVAIPLTVVSVAAIVWSQLWPRDVTPRRNESRDAGVAEGTLLLSLIALPYIVFALVCLVNGPLLSRYVLAAIFGVVVGMACALSIAGRKAAVILALFGLCSVSMRELRFWRHPTYDPFVQYSAATSAEQLSQMMQFVQSAGHEDLPVVVSDSQIYTQLVYYSPQLFANRLVYLVDERRELSYKRSDTSSKLMLALREFMPLGVTEYSEFTAAHREFLLYSGDADWYLAYLSQEAASVQLLAKASSGDLCLVKMKEGHPR